MKHKINLFHDCDKSSMIIFVIPSVFLKSPIRNVFGMLNSLNPSQIGFPFFNIKDKLSEFKGLNCARNIKLAI